MSIDRETGKDRWRRVPKDYFRQPDPFRRTRLRLSVLALVAALGWWASGLDWFHGGTTQNDAGRWRVSRGPVARVHATWDRQCDACHVPFAAIDGRPLLASLGLAGVGSSRDEKAVLTGPSASDHLCSSCHKVGVHHQAVIAGEVPACAQCHRDHRGRDASLVRTPDSDCTACHGNLGVHINLTLAQGGPAVSTNSQIHEFQRDHPPFRPLAAKFPSGGPPVDRSRLKFNHALHMRPGLVAHEGDTPYTVARIPVAAERSRYRTAGGTDAEPVRLDCASCHVLPTSDDGRSGPGSYYQPVAYETSCRACHVLSFDPRKPDLVAPHGVEPAEVAAFLRRTYAAEVVSADGKLLDTFVPPLAVPGQTAEATRARERLDSAVATAESLLFENTTNCRECHHLTGTDHGVVPARVEPTAVPEVWFSRARFDHAAHRAVSCRDCHARAYAIEADGKTPVANASVANTDVLVPEIANCRQCHGPDPAASGWLGTLAGTTTSAMGRASQDCVECHRYHDGDRPARGPGSTVRDDTPERSVAEFLSGVRPRPPHGSN